MAKFDSKKLIRNLTVGRGSILTPHIDAYQYAEKFPDKWIIEIENTRVDDGCFHPSVDALASIDELYKYKTNQTKPTPITPALRRVFDCGHMWHRYVQNILIDMKFVDEENVERYIRKRIVRDSGECEAAGTGDLVGVRIPGYSDSWLVDIKTMNKAEFELGASENTLKKWQAQVNCYGDWFGFSQMMVLAICKDSPHNFREYIIQPDPDLLSDIYEKWILIENCIKSGKTPEEYLTNV